MALDTYENLKTEIAVWLSRSDLTARIPVFITLAEAAMNRALRVKGSTGRATATVDTEYSDLPTNFAEAISITTVANGQIVNLDPVGQENMDGFEAATGYPRLYAIVGDQLRLYPTPDAAYSLTMTFFQKLPALSASVASNWVLASHPDAYLYGALLHAGPFLRDDEATAMHKALFDAAVSQMLRERRLPGGKLRVDPALLTQTRFNMAQGR